MKSWNRGVFVLAGCALLAFAGAAHAGQVWTDANGDGQPDLGTIPATVSQTFAVDLWIDSQSFAFTGFNIWAEWSGVTQTNPVIDRMTGCVNDPHDTDVPIHFSGGGCNPPKHGVFRVGTIGFHVDVPSGGCVAPIIDPQNPNNVFSLLTSPSGYMLFQTRHGSCFGPPPNANEDRSWGKVKGLYR